MDRHQQLARHGLFDMNVPRYTSYPPANHFAGSVGFEKQVNWLGAIPDGSGISLYIHIPFCQRLCWFCACRTQGTRSLRPVARYIDVLLQELAMVRALLAPSVKLSRLHLGGGTPTILDGPLMDRLLDSVFAAFQPGKGFEFSAEIDPTAAAPDVLDVLIQRGLNRASIGVQDFASDVQEAIGRPQSFAQTHEVAAYLRQAGVRSLNVDLLYGLPHQTAATMAETLQKVLAIQPDRLALYGYAHVPWMSKRQVMIDEAQLPGPLARFALSEQARVCLASEGFAEIGIDHFARAGDGLLAARDAGRLRRNFQGYTDDPSPYLVGLGASAISRFPQGYVQNATATSVYTGTVSEGRLAGTRGHALSRQDAVIARLIENMMCDLSIDLKSVRAEFPDNARLVDRIADATLAQFADVCVRTGDCLRLCPGSRPLARIIAASFDRFQATAKAHSAAI